MASAAAELTVGPAIELWLGFAPAPPLAAGVLELAQADSFAIFDAMRSAGVADVRRVGVLCSAPPHVAAARAAGAGAVVAVGDGKALSAAAPDALVAPHELDALVAARYGADGSQRRLVLLNPGPALTSDAVKRAAAGADVCHREPEFRELDRRIRSKLRTLAGVGPDWTIALLSGSGTSANEATLRAAVRPGQRLLVVVNGVYGERLREAARRAGIDTVSVEGGWTEPIDVARVADALAAEDALDALAVVHHETTTGLLNPLAELARTAAAAGVRTVVDAISSFGVEEITLGDGIDYMTCTSNKCLHGLPGAAFVLVSPAGARRARSVEPSSVALDLCAYLDVDASGSPPFTPAIPALAALDVALDHVLVEGIAGRRARYAERCAIVDAAFERLGLEQLVAAPARSHSIRSVRLPNGVSFAALHERLRAAGFVIYAGQGALAAQIFRVACMGELEPSDLHDFVAALERALAELGA
ncbi:MAG TPA: aminotransferase class V-fold PLP-dependent enzyme [Gaiellaceae bacterium]|nr:aminotransferase class V-fold PLP-dependent enzyme [Gaiellaceae bacterium]